MRLPAEAVVQVDDRTLRLLQNVLKPKAFLNLRSSNKTGTGTFDCVPFVRFPRDLQEPVPFLLRSFSALGHKFGDVLGVGCEVLGGGQ